MSYPIQDIFVRISYNSYMGAPDSAVIAIDGPAGSGKTTLARGISESLGIPYLVSGAIYRALALKAIREGLNPKDEAEAVELAHSARIDFEPAPSAADQERVFLDGEDVTDQLSGNEVSVAASAISRHPGVRRAMVDLQRAIVERLITNAETNPEGLRGAVVEGRDIGTVVFPEAEVKIFLNASLDERARRRMSDFDRGGADLENAKAHILARDLSDTKRPVGALMPAPDAILLDNTDLEKEETLARALEVIRERIAR